MVAELRHPADSATLVDVSMRDGLQDEPTIVALEDKLAIVRALVAAGFSSIEVTSFVHPTWVPQLADAAELIEALPAGPRYSALILNQRGYKRAVRAFADAKMPAGTYDLVFVVSASARHALANNNRTIDESLTIYDEIAKLAGRQNIGLRAVVACAFGSPWADENVSTEDVAMIARRFEQGGAHTVTLADTVGLATPAIAELVLRLICKELPATRLALHLHDRVGKALENVAVALSYGVLTFEGALAGLGGCPFAPDAPGNVDLGRVAKALQEREIYTGVRLAQLPDVVTAIRGALARGTAISVPLAETHSPAGQR